MFGANQILKKDHGDGGTLWVQEVFYTIQGEGPFAGQPAVFIRLAGCGLACAFCDTDFESSTWHPTVGEVLEKVALYPQTSLVVLTGGEPLRQNILPLVQRLEGIGHTVQIETAGYVWLEGLSSTEVTLIVSPKTPKIHPLVENQASAYKYVVKAGEMDAAGLPTRNPQRPTEPMFAFLPADPASVIYLQPMDEGDAAVNRANIEAARDACLEHGYCISLQQHKILEVR